MSMDHAFLDILRNKSYAARRESMQGGIYVVSHQTTPSDLGRMVKRITKCAGVNLEIIRDSIPCFVYFVVCAHNAKSFDKTVQIICETCSGAGFLFTIEQFIAIWECLMRHSKRDKWVSALNIDGLLEFKANCRHDHDDDEVKDAGSFPTVDLDYYRKLFNYYYAYHSMCSEDDAHVVSDPAIIAMKGPGEPGTVPSSCFPSLQHQYTENGGLIIANEDKLKDVLANRTLVFKAPHMKTLAGGVVEGTQTSTMTDIMQFYNREDQTDIFLITGLFDACQRAARQLQQIYGKNGRAYTTKQYFDVLKEKKIPTRPVSSSTTMLMATNTNSPINSHRTPRRGGEENVNEQTFVMGSSMPNKKISYHRLSYQELTNQAHDQFISNPNLGAHWQWSSSEATKKQSQYHLTNRFRVPPTARSKRRHYRTPFSFSSESIPHSIQTESEVDKCIKRNDQIQYTTFELLSRYRTSASKEYPHDWDYLVTICPEIFTYDFVQERIDNYLNYWDLEEY